MLRLLVLILLFAPAAAAQQSDLHKELEALRRDHEAQSKRLAELEKQLGGQPKDAQDEHRHTDVAHAKVGDVDLRLIDISLNGLFAAGFSSATNDELEGLQAGGHDPRRRGFTLQQIEFSITGAVDPYFKGEGHIVIGEDGFELEEAFLITTSLPAGLEVEAGHFFTEFGLINPVHPHDWDFMDHPVIHSRLLGPDGLRGSGVRLGWEMPLPWFSKLHAGVQNANEPIMVSFNGAGHAHEGEGVEETVGGWPRVERGVETAADLLYLLRWENGVALSDWRLNLGVSGLFGPNASGDHGKTWIFGGDVLLKFKPPGHEHSVLKIQGEFMYRYFQAEGATLEDSTFLEPTVLGDWGGYLQGTVNVYHHVFVGLRVEFADAFRDGEELRREDPLRDRRYRVSPMIQWSVSHFARLRLQYNFEHMEHLDRSPAHSVWFGVEFLIGAHGRHDD
ncbi:MAG: hypothetical protein IT462_05560 [Planctomycetes bacterium]|nr:hypothetical protein [Planctomycetota bacterium]